MLTRLRPLGRFWSPGAGACRLARNAPVLALAMLVLVAELVIGPATIVPGMLVES